jgi:hypothetical protein
MNSTFLWGIIALVCGGFMLVYGGAMVRFVLAFFGFYFGMVATGILMNALGLAQDSPWLLLLVEVIVGSIIGLVFFRLVSLTVYLAGAILGLSLGLFVAAALNLNTDWLTLGVVVVAAVIGGIFGKNLGDWLVVLAASVAGAYASVTGIGLLFQDPTVETAKHLMPTSLPAIVTFLFLTIIGTLAQAQIRDLRNRLVRRV